MHIAFIIGSVIIALALIWLLLRTTSDGSGETTKTILSSDKYTKILLTIIAIATSVIALQGFID